MTSYNLQELWKKACEHDGIDPKAKFVSFSKDNPWMKKYAKAMTLIQASIRLSRQQRGGTVGTLENF